MGEGLLLDWPVDDLPARVTSREQQPKVVDPVFLPTFPLYALTGGNWDTTFSAVAGFVAAWRSWVPQVALPGLAAKASYSLTGSATGEVRVQITRGAEVATSSTLSVVVGSQSNLGWLHGLDLWAAGIATVEFQARMSGGVGSFVFGRPSMSLIDRRACTVAGAWRAGVWLPGGIPGGTP